ncbi:MAG: DUF2333 family protein [Cardiobacteriaceae bacterium]|nr:DUF2333 family protein [Cardiobacteriaceae bacterium]
MTDSNQPEQLEDDNKTIKLAAPNLKAASASLFSKIFDYFRPKIWKSHNWKWRILVLVVMLFIVNVVTMLYWSVEPRSFDVKAASREYLPANVEPVVGSATVGTSVKTLDILLHKKGGFIKNDVAPPGVFLDNISNWEYGVLELMRHTTLTFANDFSRSQSQSSRPKILSDADNSLRIDSAKWILPAPEDNYEQARQNLIEYGKQIADKNANSAKFYARADNLVSYLELISKQLGDITQQLSASVGDTVMAAQVQSVEEANAEENANKSAKLFAERKRTPYWQIDNNFYFARGYSWALLQELRAIRIDFEKILRQKEALASLDQIIFELEKTQKPIWSPMILNGSGFGFMTNHSLIMASYISRANAAIIELKNLLSNG